MWSLYLVLLCQRVATSDTVLTTAVFFFLFLHGYASFRKANNQLSLGTSQILQLGPGHTRGFLQQVSAASESGYLDFENRELPLFPDQLTDFAFLININLSYNKIDRIPPAITNMVQLQVRPPYS